MISLVVLLVFQPPALFSQPQAAEKKCVIEGTVVNAITNEPLRKASVVLQGNPKGTPAVITSADGKFCFENIEPHSYDIGATRQGFLDSEDEPDIDIEAGEQVKDVLIKLVPQGVIAGHIVDEDGDPVDSARVAIERAVRIHGQRKVLENSWNTTNEEGYFLFAGLKPGRYYLSATSEPARSGRLSHSHSSPRPADGFLTTYYPDVTDMNGAIPVEIIPGFEARDIKIHLRKGPVFRVAGRVTNNAAEQAAINLTGGSRSSQVRIVNGKFEFNSVEPGDYVLEMASMFLNNDHGEFVPQRAKLFCHVPVTVSERDVEDLVVDLVPGANLTAVVRMDDHTSFENPQNVNLVGHGFLNGRASKDANSFEWTNLSPGRYFLDYGPPRGAYVKSTLFNDQPLSNTAIDVGVGGGGKIEIVVAKHAAEISATVRDENGVPIHNATVLLWSGSPEPGHQHSNQTDMGGNAYFDGLAPGDYHLLAWPKIESDLLDVPEFIALFEPKSIMVKEGAHENVDVKVISKAMLEKELAKLQ